MGLITANAHFLFIVICAERTDATPVKAVDFTFHDDYTRSQRNLGYSQHVLRRRYNDVITEPDTFLEAFNPFFTLSVLQNMFYDWLSLG
jgi:hypothetical protein